MDGSTLGALKKFKEYRIKTEDLIYKLESNLVDFEKTKDPQKLYEGTKDAIQRFMESL